MMTSRAENISATSGATSGRENVNMAGPAHASENTLQSSRIPNRTDSFERPPGAGCRMLGESHYRRGDRTRFVAARSDPGKSLWRLQCLVFQSRRAAFEHRKCLWRVGCGRTGITVSMRPTPIIRSGSANPSKADVDAKVIRLRRLSKLRAECLNSNQFLSLGDGGKPKRRTKSRKRGEERKESNTGAVRRTSVSMPCSS